MTDPTFNATLDNTKHIISTLQVSGRYSREPAPTQLTTLVVCLSVSHECCVDHKPQLLDVTAAEAYTRSFAIGCKLCAVIRAAGRRTHGTTFWALKVSWQAAAAAAGAKSS